MRPEASSLIQVFLEFLESEQKSACAHLLRYAEPLASLKKKDDEKSNRAYKRLEGLLNRPYIPTAKGRNDYYRLEILQNKGIKINN